MTSLRPRHIASRYRPVQPETLHAWFLHEEMLSGLFDDTSRTRLQRFSRHRLGVGRGSQQSYTRELERWLSQHAVLPLSVAVATDKCVRGALVWCELEFTWSEVAAERQSFHAGATDVRSWFQALLLAAGDRRIRVHGTFNPSRLTYSTSGVELRGTRHQWVLGQVASVTDDEIELRPLAIATRLLTPPGGGEPEWTAHPSWQRIDVSEVEQFAHIDFTAHGDALTQMRAVPEVEVKKAIARLIGEPVVPKDWGGEQSDLWTTRLRVDGRAHSAAFVLKGPAGGSMWRPMKIGMLGKNGDQLQRLASSPAEILVVQHCHEIEPVVVSMLENLASDMRNPRRFMVIDGYDSYALIKAARDLGDAANYATP